MTPEQVVAHFGGKNNSVGKAARKLGITPAAIYHWMKTNTIPDGTQARIQIKTNGKLKADPVKEEE